MIGFVTGGCSGDSDSTAGDNALNQGNARGAAAQQQIDVDFTGADANAQMAMGGEILLTIDDRAISESQAALPLITDTKAIDYANAMINEHTQHRNDTIAMLSNIGIAPTDSPTAAMLRNEAAAGVRDIQAANNPDSVYLQVQISDHQENLMILGRLDQHIDNPTFDAFIKSTASMENTHRDDAVAKLRDL